MVPSLVGGGSEKVVADLSAHWASQEREVTVVTLRSTRTDAYRLDSQVRRISLGYEGLRWYRLWSQLRLVRALRRAILESDPRLVVSFILRANLLTALSLGCTRIPLVISEQSVANRTDISPATRFARGLLYRRADVLIVLTMATKRAFHRILGDRQRIDVVPNYVLPPEGPFHTQMSAEKLILAVGRLHPVKGFDVLLKAFRFARLSETKWKLVILGEGAERDRLERLRDKLNLSDSVEFPGRVPDPSHYYRRAGLFVQSSRFEGFGIALVEAMSYGIPVISTDCPTGPGEIITSDSEGVLVPPEDPEKLGCAILELVNDARKRKKLAAGAARRADDFNANRILGKWDAILESYGCID